MEGLRLRIKEIDFGQVHIIERDGKSRKDRATHRPAGVGNREAGPGRPLPDLSAVRDGASVGIRRPRSVPLRSRRPLRWNIRRTRPVPPRSLRVGAPHPSPHRGQSPENFPPQIQSPKTLRNECLEFAEKGETEAPNLMII
jgi:hypothetical protein